MPGDELDRIRTAYRARDSADGPSRSLAELASPATCMSSSGRCSWRCGLRASRWTSVRCWTWAAGLATSCTGSSSLARATPSASISCPSACGRHGRAIRTSTSAARAQASPPAKLDVVTQFMCLSSVLDASLRGRIAAEAWRTPYRRHRSVLRHATLRRALAPRSAADRRPAHRRADPVVPARRSRVAAILGPRGAAAGSPVQPRRCHARARTQASGRRPPGAATPSQPFAGDVPQERGLMKHPL